MSNQVPVLLDQKVYDGLLQLQVPPCSTINDVINRLLFLNGHKSNEVIGLEREENHFSLEDEIERAKAGIYSTAGS